MDLLSTYAAHYSKKEKTTYLLLKFISKNRLHFNESQCLLPSITLIEISFFIILWPKLFVLPVGKWVWNWTKRRRKGTVLLGTSLVKDLIVTRSVQYHMSIVCKNYTLGNTCFAKYYKR